MEQAQTPKAEAQQTNPNNIDVGDRVVFYEGQTRLAGTVGATLEENNVTKLDVNFDNGTQQRVKANDNQLQPLFFRNKQTGNKTQTQFSYKEVVDYLKNNNTIGFDYNNLGPTAADKSRNLNKLRVGSKTDVLSNIQIKKQATENTPAESYNVSARFQLYLKDGQIRNARDLQNQELKLDQVLGKSLNAEQQAQLAETGRLGLVKDFVVKDTGELYNAWVGVDPELKKIITRPENSVKIDKLYGRDLTAKEQEVLRAGKGALMDFKTKTGEKFKAYVYINPATTTRSAIVRLSENLAKERNLPNALEQKKKSKSQGQKIS